MARIGTLRRSLLSAVLLLAIGLTMSACARPGTPSPAPATPTGAGGTSERRAVPVVVTLPVFVSLVEAVGGELVEVTSLVPVGADPHTYQPTPRDAQRLADARIVFMNGRGLDAWLGDLIAATSSGTRVVELSAGIEVDETEHSHPEEEATPVPEDDHQHEEGNPHLWLDPDYAVSYIHVIARTLAEVDPAGAATYQANADRYSDEIRQFDAWARGQVEQIPPERRKLVTFHDAFPYFAEHYGLELVGVVVLSPGRDPSPQELAQLVDLIRQQGVPAVFTEPQFNPKLAETLAHEAGVRVLELYSDSPPAGEDYIGMMRRNIEHVVEGLS